MRSPGAVGRRALLVSGLAGLGVGAAGGYALADAVEGSPRPVPSAGRLEYGPAPSGSDDSGRLQTALDAMSGGGTLALPAGRYQVDARLVVPPGVHLVGSGGFPLGAGTLLACAPGSGIWFRGGSNGARDLAVEGAGTRGAPPSGPAAISVGGPVGEAAGADCYFANVSVGTAAADGWLVQGAQNSTFVNCRVQGSRGDGLVLDQSAGGHLFQRFESAGSGGYNLRIRQSAPASAGGYAIPADNTFIACIFEQRATPGPAVLLEHADTTSFLHCAFASTPAHETAGDASSLVEIQAGRVDFVSPVVYLTGAGRSAFGVHGARQHGSPTVAVIGLAAVGGGAGAFADVDSASTLLLDGTVLGLHSDTPSVATQLLTASTPSGRVYSHRQAAIQVDGDVTARRYVGPPSTTTLSADGPLIVDASAAQQHVVMLAGHDLSGLSLRNAAAGQSLTLILVQSGQPSSVRLPGAAQGFLWSGGDAHIPTVTSPGGYLAVVLTPLGGDRWLELSRAGTDVAPG